MKIRNVMTSPAIRISASEPVSVAARTLEHYNIGALPVCDEGGKLCGVVTDRDIVVRCLAGDRRPENTPIRQIMTGRVETVTPDTDAREAARLMGARQIRRLPVVENGRLLGMVSLGDLANSWQKCDALADALTDISSNISSR